ncbi:SDR family oxidoreductase [Planctomicrobium sp. SH661]|uniref:SDR family oxidoreductase n=1 Tax=Planctomicrobium sp. SH661 TaxID=3448124 RepID=UPI003F5B4E59
MKIVVVGGYGLIGSQVVANLREVGHDVVAASPRSGVNTLTGEGLEAALAGAQMVLDVSNSPSFEDEAVLKFFQISTRNLLSAEAAAGVGHHIALSIVGADRIPDSGYMRAKVVQENLIKQSGVPYTILRATQFFEFIEGIAASCMVGETVHAPDALIQPVAAEDVAHTLSVIAQESPVNGTLELAGPDAVTFEILIRTWQRVQGKTGRVITDQDACYFGAKLARRALIPADEGSLLGTVSFEQWLGQHAVATMW